MGDITGGPAGGRGQMMGGISPQLLQAALGHMQQQFAQGQGGGPQMSPNVANFAQHWNQLPAPGGISPASMQAAYAHYPQQAPPTVPHFGSLGEAISAASGGATGPGNRPGYGPGFTGGPPTATTQAIRQNLQNTGMVARPNPMAGRLGSLPPQTHRLGSSLW